MILAATYECGVPLLVRRAPDEDHARSDEVGTARALRAGHGNHIERAGTTDSRSRGALRSRSGGAGVASPSRWMQAEK